MTLEQSKANTAKTLAKTYAPKWNIPDALQWFSLPERELASIFSSSLKTLRILRGIWQDRLEAIEDGTYYQRGDFGTHVGLDSYYNAQRKEVNRATKFNLDRCEAYHMLWWIDVFINVHITP